MNRVSRRKLLARGLALGGGLGLGGAEAAQLLIPSWRGQTVEAATTAQPKRGGTLVAAAEVDPVSLDPHTNSNFSAAQGFEHLYESLTGYNEKNQIVPMLAQKWELSNGGKTYIFHLRPNVKFHNGQTMTAEDVKYSIDRVLDPKTASPWRSWFNAIEEIKVIDPLTVQMNLSAPYPGLLGSFAGMRASGIVPKGLAERENLKIKAIGTGPFKLVEFVPQDHITYARHPDYWDQPLPYLDGMTFKVLPEMTAREGALRAGQVQYASINAQGAEQLARVPGIKVLKGLIATVTLQYINVAAKPLNDSRVRKALRMAVDTNEIIQKAEFGAAVPSGPIPTGYGDWYLDPKTLPYTKPDIEGAKKLLAEAGYPGGGFKIELKCSPQYPQLVAISLVVQDAVKKLGVDAQVVQQEWGAFVKDNDTVIRTGGKEGGEIFASGNTFRPDPDGYIYPYFHVGGERNYGGYSNPKLEPLMRQARTIFNHDQRRSLYVEIQRTLLEESPNWWWYVAYNIEATSEKVQGYAQSFTGRRFLLKKAWLSS
ncbi:MAG TPA: ABC transporter substrate-binding protein [bacterium]|nr:ABC transporter substrate-binding protein [bacterium]